MLEYDVIDLYTKRRKRQITIAILAIPLVAARFFKTELRQLDFVNDQYFTYAILGLVGGLVIYSFFNWRCPKCNVYLGRSINLKHCSKCGVQLVES